MIISYSFHAEEPGARLLVTGAVHGNEKCGTYAIRKILQEMEDGQISLERGSVTFVPICNPQAFDADKRYIERNLNRFLIPHKKPDCYEARLGNILCPLLADCDVLLDLHSYSIGGSPFVFVGPSGGDYPFARSLGGAAALLTGWQTAYAASGRDNAPANPDEPIGTTEYARRFGAVAVTLECGGHKDPLSVDIAYNAIKGALAHLQMVVKPAAISEKKHSPLLIEVKKVYYRDNGGGFVKQWQHLDRVSKGEIIAKDNAGNALTVPDEGYVILPHANTPEGTEWFYWGQESDSL